ncbi:hypothetical protein L1987_35144 [Smallanthus sonchifolius]|uniref:Uncharacterized protein n=1 Tax=Smallanthus sonchifolius TaxID=185202 RepID=A0ACB9HX70_9ASTR|nr:hypothetical protein L1987_35144 [Smallanthus sonchifolius]
MSATCSLLVKVNASRWCVDAALTLAVEGRSLSCDRLESSVAIASASFSPTSSPSISTAIFVEFAQVA